MKVLMNLLSAVAGGSLTHVRNVIAPLAREFEVDGRHQLRLLVHRSQLAMLSNIPNLKMHIIDGVMPRSYRRLIWEKWNIRAYLGSIDVYFIPYQVGPLPKHVRTVLMLQNMEPFWHWRYPYDLKTRMRNETLNLLTWCDLRRADRVIAVSNFSRSYLTGHMGVPPERSVTVYNGCGPEFRAPPAASDAELLTKMGVNGDFVFTSGSLLPYRRLEDVIAAFARVAASRRNLLLVITGGYLNDRYVAQIRSAIHGSGVGNQIVMLGSVSTETMAVLYRSCACFVAASEIEACPYTILEAMASGCAIIAPNRPPFPELMGSNGLNVAARDVDAFSTSISKVVEDAALRNRLKHDAREASKRFSWERCARETFQALTVW